MADLYPSIPENLPSSLPVVALRRGVLLPGTTRAYLVGRPRSLNAIDHAIDELVLVAVQREPVADPSPSDLLPTAVLARVLQRSPTDRGKTERVAFRALGRVTLTGFPSSQPHLSASFQRVDDQWPDSPEAEAMLGAFHEELELSAEALDEPAAIQALKRLASAHQVDAVASLVGADDEGFQRQVLTTHDALARTEQVIERVVRVREALAARKSIRDRVQESTRDAQREFVLRQQLKAIQEELGQGEDGDDMTRLRERLAEVELPEEVREVVDRELRRLERINQGPEKATAVDWLEWIADLPWQTYSGVDADLVALEQALDRTHYGLDDVKKQVVEHLAVRKLAGTGRADVLLLVGPPGVGKTSIGQAIADATGRKLLRVALGGVRDEAEIRGHRRTYIGARPGRLIEGIRRAGTADPVVLLDEVDKLGTGSWGNPSAALLELLDPEQNHTFTDRYLEVPFDLSKVLFVATANDLSRVPGPLRDRMEVIDIAGYTADEKLHIARNHLLQTVAKNAGLPADAVSFTEEALRAAITGWTREAGVRGLQRVLGKVYRAAAVKRAKGDTEAVLEVDVDNLSTWLGKRRFHDAELETSLDRPGLVRGLAWTPVGGTVLHVEASTFPGRGQLVLTGQLGDVMKESARAALTYVLAQGDALGIPADALENKDLHIHVPAGAVPKDGPSAGVTMFTAVASLLSGRTVRDDVAMTGEATLRGRVLPVGGIKSKVLAAHRLGLKRIILPRRNGIDLDDLPDQAREELDFVLVDSMEEVLTAALMDPPEVPIARGESTPA